MNQAQRKIVNGITSLVDGLLDEAVEINGLEGGKESGTPYYLVNEAERFIGLVKTPYYRTFFPKDRLEGLESRYNVLKRKSK